MANEHKYTRWFSSCGSRGYEIRRRRILGGFSYRQFVYRDNWWYKDGKRRAFKTLHEATMVGEAYIG